ncbi:MAG TPA: TIGR02147 family protein [Fibrobacteria bacterium]|nr:TIGR02147 family protein [Fibrobacteria bacterium]HOX51156.1 TIGR02147 family protein [Fibrobacteria bacterium]
MAKPDIHDYLEYRSYLKAAFAAEKESGSIAGQRDVATFLGLKSSGHISWILQGKRDLMPRLVPRLAQLLGLDATQTEYLALLVEHNDTDNPDDRRRALAAISRCQANRKARLKPGKVAYLSSWKHATVRELLAMGDFRRQDAARLAAHLVPPCSTEEVDRSLELLEELDLVETAPDGTLRRTETVVTAGADCSQDAVRGFQESILDLSRQALRTIPREARHISTITFSASPERFQKIRSRIQEMRQEILTLIRTDPDPSVVYHLSIQAFPASRPFESGHA